jgi:hypothetical protein
MRRTARALSVAALAGAALGAAAPAASADPAAEVSPGTVSPGDSVTVSVSCDPLDGSAPAAIEAVSQAFEDGTAELKRVSGNDEKTAGPAYNGTARVPPAENFEGDPDAAGSESAWTVDGTCPEGGAGEGKEWSASFTVARESGGGGEGGPESGTGSEAGGKGSSSGDEEGWTAEGGAGGTEGGDEGGAGLTEGGGHTEGGAGLTEGGGHTEGGAGHTEGGEGRTEGGGRTCTEPHSGMSEGGRGESDWNAPDTGSDKVDPYLDATGTEQAEPHADATEPYWDAGGHGPGKGESHGEDCGGDPEQHGVQAGTGGAFTDSVPALVAGGLLIAGAFGGAVYRLRRGAPGAED